MDGGGGRGRETFQAYVYWMVTSKKSVSKGRGWEEWRRGGEDGGGGGG